MLTISPHKAEAKKLALNQFSGAIFDLDGTLLDSMHVWDDVDVAFLQRRGLEVPEGYGDVLAPLTFLETAEYTITRFHLKETPEEVMAEWNQLALEAYRHTVKLKPYARELLLHCKALGLKLGVCTALSKELHVPALQAHGLLDWFDAIVTTDDVQSSKSLPAPFLAVANRMGVAPKDCVVFDDIPEAIAGAKLAGMTTVGVEDDVKFSPKLKALADVFVKNLGEIYN